MTYDDYYQLVRRYNPHVGWDAHKRNAFYARQFELDGLSVSQTIIQLKQDKEANTRYFSDKYVHRPLTNLSTQVDEPSKDRIDGFTIIACFLVILYIIGIVARVW